VPSAGRSTRALSPSKSSAEPKRPVVHVAPTISPWLPWPDASDNVVPDPSSNEYAATGAPASHASVSTSIAGRVDARSAASTVSTATRYVVPHRSPVSSYDVPEVVSTSSPAR
jgi:hypothetical protein